MIDQAREVILNLLFARLKHVALGEEKGGEYTTKDYVNDIYKMVWEGTLKHRSLEKHEIRLQTAFVGKVLASSTITTSSGNFTPQKGMALVDRGFMSISDKWLDDSKLLAYLESGERLVQGGEMQSGFYPAREEILPGNYLNVSFYYDMLSRMQTLLQGEIQQSSGDTKLHYEYLLYKIKKAMKK